MERTASLLAPLLKRLGIDEEVRFIRIRNDWQTIFETSLSIHMSPSRLLEGELLLTVDSPIWMQQLSFCKPDLLAKLKQYGVRDLRFRVGAVSRRAGKKKAADVPETRELTADDKGFIDRLTCDISNAELREAVRTAATRSLRSKKREADRH
ncbi:MAG: DUF721 domain-containing protein [Nitrospirae bacterium]|nr:MAG: DUF721 domain-containing protein [Nitrospirota bacterium]